MTELPLPPRPFDVICADPPWEYDFSSSKSRRIENHYPPQPLAEICGLPVAEVSAPDSVLYLWGTAPKLIEALTVMEAWGFRYRTGGVWNKVLMGPGRYFRVQHEHILIGTRGRYLEPVSKSERSVFREARTGHSVKPDIVYEALVRMYPDGRRLELYARQERPGWTVWGNEVVGAGSGH